MKVWIYKVDGWYDAGDEVRKVFDTKEKAEKWHKRMIELSDLHSQYHKDGTVKQDTSECPEIIALRKEACCAEIGNDEYNGEIIEMELE